MSSGSQYAVHSANTISAQGGSPSTGRRPNGPGNQESDLTLPKGVVLDQGEIGLSISNPNQYRRELVTKIIDDLKFITELMDGGITLPIEGLDRTIKVRSFNETDVELLIGYNFKINYTNQSE